MNAKQYGLPISAPGKLLVQEYLLMFPLLKIPHFKDSRFKRFPILKIPAFKDSRFYRFPLLNIPLFKDSPFRIPHSISHSLTRFPIPFFKDHS